MANLLAAHGAIRNALQEHQRWKLDDDFPFAMNQVNDHRNGDGGEAGEERGREEVHLAHPRESLPRREERKQRAVERLGGIEYGVVGV